MSDIALEQITKAEHIVKVISQIKTPINRLQSFWNMGLGGSAVDSPGGGFVGWDIFDQTRTMAQSMARDAGPSSAAAQVVGHKSAQVNRSHEKIHLSHDRIFRNRPLGGQYGSHMVDVRGQSYITKQQGYLAQRFTNVREFLVSSMMKGGLTLTRSGAEWLPSVSGGTISIDFGVPDGNKLKLNMVGEGDILGVSWDDATADIITDCLQINAAFEELHGYPLRHIWINSNSLGAILENTQLSTVAGTANTVFNEFRPETPERTELRFTFKAIPWLTWHIYDAGLIVGGSFTKMIPDNQAIFLPDPDPQIAEWLEGSEFVRENLHDPGQERFGFHAWVTETIDPAGLDLKALDNGLPALYIPKAVAYGTIIYA